MDLGIQGKKALVTGASKGIGKACALALAREGVAVALCARGKPALDQTVAELRALGAQAVGIQADMRNLDDCQRLLRETVAQLGPIDILVTNLHEGDWGTFDELTNAQLRDSFHELLGLIELTRGVVPGLKERRWGRLIHITSVSAKEPNPDNPLFLEFLTRPGCVGFQKGLSYELAVYGITTNTVLVSGTDTPRRQDFTAWFAQRPKQEGAGTRRSPTGRIAQPKEIGDVVAFLSSMRASYVNGIAIAVEGGSLRGIV